MARDVISSHRQQSHHSVHVSRSRQQESRTLPAAAYARPRGVRIPAAKPHSAEDVERCHVLTASIDRGRRCASRGLGDPLGVSVLCRRDVFSRHHAPQHARSSHGWRQPRALESHSPRPPSWRKTKGVHRDVWQPRPSMVSSWPRMAGRACAAAVAGPFATHAVAGGGQRDIEPTGDGLGTEWG